MARNIPVIIQARMSSRRLPGKMLTPMCGVPMLAHLLRGLNQGNSPVVLATSTNASDDPLESFCQEQGITCFRGPLDDVATRFALVVQELESHAFVRVCGDSPLLDFRLIDQAVKLFHETESDIVTNVHPRRFPKGQSVEVINATAFSKARSRMQTPEHREHVTAFLYAHAQDFCINSFSPDTEWQDLQMSVDTAEDFHSVERLLESLERPHWEYGWQELAQRMTALSGWKSC